MKHHHDFTLVYLYDMSICAFLPPAGVLIVLNAFQLQIKLQ